MGKNTLNVGDHVRVKDSITHREEWEKSQILSAYMKYRAPGKLGVVTGAGTRLFSIPNESLGVGPIYFVNHGGLAGVAVYKRNELEPWGAGVFNQLDELIDDSDIEQELSQ